MRNTLLVVYGLVVMVNLVGLAAPYIPATFFPLTEYTPICWLPSIPVHLLALKVCNKNLKLLRGVALICLIGCIWIGQKEIHFSFKSSPPENALKVLSFNVQNFQFKKKGVDDIIAAIAAQKPDIVCLQEMRLDLIHPEGNDRITKETEKYIAAKLGMPYHHFVAYRTHIVGIAYFSKYPIIEFDTCFMNRRIVNGGVIATIQSPHGKVGVANLHLTSYNVQDALKNKNTGLGKLWAFTLRSKAILSTQIELVQRSNAMFQAYPHPLIVTGDMNALPHSNIMYILGKNLTDSFTEAGNGIGISFPVGPYGIRIDHQLHNAKVQAHRLFVVPKNTGSDHYMSMGFYTLK